LRYGFSRKNNWVASLERIDPGKGYTKDNVCLICAEFNGHDRSASVKYSNGGSGAWSVEKFKYFLSILEKQQTPEDNPIILPQKKLYLNILT